MSELTELWAVLESEAPTAQGWLTRRLKPESRNAQFAAASGASRLPALLLEVGGRAIPSQVELPSGRGFEVTIFPLTPGPTGRVYVVLQLTDAAYRNVFASLAEDVSGAIATAPGEREAVRAFVSRLRIWQEFLRRHSEGLSVEEQIGLFAELWVLRMLLLPRIGAHAAVDAWRGPSGAEHDFVRGGLGLEVKASLKSPPVGFRVSSLLQLDETRREMLVVALVRLAVSPSGVSLPQLVDRVRSEITALVGSPLRALDDKLLAAGYADAHAPLYEDQRLNADQPELFHIREGFPRLRPRDMPTGIIECSYEVNTAACAPFRVSIEDFANRLGGE